jgi:hypothetical protein
VAEKATTRPVITNACNWISAMPAAAFGARRRNQARHRRERVEADLQWMRVGDEAAPEADQCRSPGE